MINSAPIASQSSLNVGESRLTRDLSRNMLNSFMNRSKVEEQRRQIHAFKVEFLARFLGRLMRSWRWIDGHDRSWERLDELVTIVALIS